MSRDENVCYILLTTGKIIHRLLSSMLFNDQILDILCTKVKIVKYTQKKTNLLFIAVAKRACEEVIYQCRIFFLAVRSRLNCFR